MAWADGCITTRELLRNWIVVCVANFVGATGLALLVWLSGHAAMNGGAVGETIANMYYFPFAMLLGAPIGWADFARNMAPMIAGNIVAGSVLVALVYYVIYVRPGRRRLTPEQQ